MSDMNDLIGGLISGYSVMWLDDDGFWIKKVEPSKKDKEVMAAIDAAIAEFRTSGQAKKTVRSND